MTRDDLIDIANDILITVRSEAKYRELSQQFDNCYDEESLIALSDYFERRLSEELMRVIRDAREEVECIINERLARASGAI